jgi:hypothetical protein
VHVDLHVTDNSFEARMNELTRRSCLIHEAVYHPTRTSGCYTAANMVAPQIGTDFVCFPSDDGWYAPEFAARMLRAAEADNADLVHCDMLHDPSWRGSGRYTVVETRPEVNWVDKGGFIVRADLFRSLLGFRVADPEVRCAADGAFVEAAVRSGARVARVPEVMFFHG